MKIQARISPTGAYIPVIINSSEIKAKKPILFLLDTGAYTSAIRASDISSYIDFIKLTKNSKFIYGIGGSQTSYILHEVILYFLSDAYKWIEGKRFKTLGVIPFIYNAQLGQRLKIPSVIGIDIIGNNFSLYYGKNHAYLESIEDQT